MVTARKWIIVKEFYGEVTPDNFSFIEEELPPLREGEILIEALYLTVDPYMRLVPVDVGRSPMGEQVAKVIESKNTRYPIGKLVLAFVGWRDKTVLSPEDPNPYFIPPSKALSDLPELGNFSPSLYLGVLGMPGMTAYFGFLEKCKPKPGDTVLVSSAAGAVGFNVGQIAKIHGCTVIGSAGTKEKCDRLKKDGFDHVFNYKETTVGEALKQYAPNGVDCYFDNVGGEYSQTVLSMMSRHGRVCLCGQISQYNATATSPGKDIFSLIMMKELVVSGIDVYSHQDKFDNARKEMAEWIKKGKLKYIETIRKDFMKMPDAFMEIFKGTATGKIIVKA